MSNNITVLIVDDDITNRLILKMLIKETGYISIEAENGQQAVDACLNNHIDIVLMDVMMPVMDGYQAARLIKQKIKTFIPIIFLTALADEKSLAKCIEAGGDDFLTKPYNHIILQSKIESMLRIGSLYRKIEKQNLELNKHNARIENEIDVAKSVFSNILNHDLEGLITGLKYSMSSAAIFNGDMIIAERNQSDGLDVLISDFTGHGLSAALGSLPVADIFYTMTSKGFSFTETLCEINNKLIKLLPTQMFMSAALISIDRINGAVSVVNCGLPDIVMVRKGKIKKCFSSTGIPLGIVRIDHENLSVEMEIIDYGDRVFAATDGLMESVNGDGEMFGQKRVLKSIESATSDELIFDELLDRCDEFSGNAHQTDDITLLELCHLENVKYKSKDIIVSDMKPSEWSMQFGLDIESIRKFDILPFIIQGINGLHSIPNGHSTVFTILTEIFTNALDHGILGLDSSIKSDAAGYMEYYQRKAERLEAKESGSIQITLSHELKEGGGGQLTIHVVDSGDGFDYQEFASTNMSSESKFFGRGLSLVSNLCEDIRFMGKGNVIMAIYNWK
ncbi:MAG: fused response regulator/phosphatase [Gammaproteobacteria bacterium]|nr:fused response regulator/phosphatase [Gammaproteobacteria bacterium]MCW8910378.1 fused response regulator/phosphatase [Gammaproteobacteria bacterium]MCW9056751.1 fused response regulator/phosphatase [Gammaproteobacteria bacterium]